MSLHLDVTVDEGEHRHSSWRVDCSNVLDYDAHFAGEELEFRDSDPLLSPYHDRRASLSFRGTPGSVDAAIGELWKAHHRMFGDCYPFGRFLNGYPLEELLEGGFGKLADGPLDLMKEYECVLLAQGVETHVSEYDPNPYENRDARLLVIGRGFIVAERFEAERLAD